MLIWCDTDSGTFWVAGPNLIVVELEEKEVEFFSGLSDSDRIAVTKVLNSVEEADFDIWSAHAAVEAQRIEAAQ